MSANAQGRNTAQSNVTAIHSRIRGQASRRVDEGGLASSARGVVTSCEVSRGELCRLRAQRDKGRTTSQQGGRPGCGRHRRSAARERLSRSGDSGQPAQLRSSLLQFVAAGRRLAGMRKSPVGSPMPASVGAVHSARHKAIPLAPKDSCMTPLLHFVSGSLALLGGALAYSTLKGGTLASPQRHRLLPRDAGDGHIGQHVGMDQRQALSLLSGLLVCYLVTTGWLTMRQPVQCGTRMARPWRGGRLVHRGRVARTRHGCDHTSARRQRDQPGLRCRGPDGSRAGRSPVGGRPHRRGTPACAPPLASRLRPTHGHDRLLPGSSEALSVADAKVRAAGLARGDGTRFHGLLRRPRVAANRRVAAARRSVRRKCRHPCARRRAVLAGPGSMPSPCSTSVSPSSNVLSKCSGTNQRPA